MEIYEHDASHMTKMATTPIYGKKASKIFFSRTGGPISLKTLYVAFGTPAHHSLFKLWPWVDLDLFFGKVNFGTVAFIYKNATMMDSFEIIEACDPEISWYYINLTK